MMNKSLVLGAALLAAGAAGAQEVGRVISSTPIVQQVAVPQQVCGQEPGLTARPTTGMGGVMGALAGGGIGSAIGSGSGRVAATMLGVIGGAILGNSVEGGGYHPHGGQVHCTTQMNYEPRTVGYNVTYEHNGQQYTTQTAQEPGATIALGGGTQPYAPQVAQSQPPSLAAPQPPIVSGPGYPQPAYPAPQGYAQPYGYVQPPVYAAPPAYAYAPPPVVVVPAPAVVYPAYRPYYRPYVAPIGISLNLGYVHRHGGRRWR